MADPKTTIVISAVDQTKAAIDSATKGIQTLSSAVGGIPGFGPLLSGLTAFASLGAFKSLITDTVAWAAEMQRASLRTGASVEALSALGKVARLSGTELASVESALVKMSKALAGADDESKAAGHAIAAIGLDVAALKSLDPAKAMLQIAKALSQWADDGSKTALVMAILGKNGAEMLPMLKDLASQTDLVGKLTQQQAEMAAKMEKEWLKLTATGGTFAKSIALDILPGLNAVLEQMTEGTRIAGGFVQAFLEFGPGMSFASGGIEATRKEIAKLNDEMARGRAQNLLDMGSTDLSGTQDSLARMQRRLEYQKVQQRQDALKNSGAAFEDPRDVLSRRLPSLNFTARDPKEGKTGRVRSAAKDRVAGSVQDYDAILLERVARAIDSTDIVKAADLAAELEKLESLAALGLDPALVKAVRDDLTGATKAAADEVKRLNDLLDKTPTAQLEKARDDMLFLTQALEDAKISEDQYLEAVTARLDLGGKLKETLSDMDQFAVQAAHNIQNAFAEFLFDPFKDGTQTMLQSFGVALRRMIADAVAADLNKRLFGDLSKGDGIGGLVGKGIALLGGLFGGGSVGAQGYVLPGSGIGAPVYGGDLPGFAVGTDYVPRDMIAQIHKGERIIPAAENRVGAGGAVNISVNLAGTSGNPAEVRRAAGQGAREAWAALQGARRYV